MQHRKNHNSVRPISSKVAVNASRAKGQHRGDQAQSVTRPNSMHDTAANDRYLPVIDVDIFNEPPSFIQKIPFISSAWVMRLFLFAAITGSVFFVYPNSLKMVTAGIDELVNKISGIELTTKSKNVSPVGVAEAAEIDNQSDNLSDILSQITSEIAAVDKSQTQGSDRGQSSVEELNQALRDKFEQKPAKKLLPKQSRQKLAYVDTLSTRRFETKALRISSADISQLLNDYTSSYQNGDAFTLAQLFLDSSTEQRLHEKLRQDYRVLFDNSTQQWVEFQNLNWVYKNNLSIGTGFIKSESTLNDNRRRTSSANVEIRLRRFNDELKIASLRLFNKKSKLLPGTATVSQYRSNQSNRSDVATTQLPSMTELDGVVSRFVWAYEDGNIDVLDRLFADNVQSNNSSNKNDIKKDYIELFATTNDRRLMISDLRWSFGAKHAKGVGHLKAIVLNANNQTTTVNGKIQFVAKKIDNQVLITHLYHIDSSQ